MSAKPPENDSRDHEQRNNGGSEQGGGPLHGARGDDMSTRARSTDGETDSATTDETTDRYDGPTFGASRFLLVAPPDTDIGDLADLWERYQSTDDPAQSDLTGWSA
jgi:hypothetical protein